VPAPFARCVTPAETALWHELFTAALESCEADPVAEIYQNAKSKMQK